MNYPKIDTSSLDELTTREWLEELPTLSVESENVSDRYTVAEIEALLTDLESFPNEPSDIKAMKRQAV